MIAYVSRSRMTGSSYSRGRGAHTIAPSRAVSVEEAVAHLRERPNDRFMRYHLQDLLTAAGDQGIAQAIRLFRQEQSPSLFSFLANVKTKNGVDPVIFSALESVGREAALELFRSHPDVHIRAFQKAELRTVEGIWDRYFSLNRDRHIPFRAIPDFAVPITAELLPVKGGEPVGIASFNPEVSGAISYRTGTGLRLVRPDETIERIIPLLKRFLDPKLPPVIGQYGGTFISLVAFPVTHRLLAGSHHHQISGQVHGSGKGVSQAAALASAAMEALERYCAAEGVGEAWPAGYQAEMALTRATLSQWQREGVAALDPNSCNLEYPYEDQPLHWVRGERVDGRGSERIMVPAQAVFQDSNLDEVDVFTGSSNGLASGNTLAEAKLHALLEVIERDGDYTMYYQPERTFALTAENQIVGRVLSAYRDKGLAVRLLDLTTDYGVPTYRAFVNLRDQILSGSGAHLNGQIAAFRALCELNTKAFVFEQHSGLVPADAPPENGRTENFEELPSFSTMNIEEDLALLERMLIANGLSSVYVDLTRTDLQVPVVRAIVPGLDIPPVLNRRQIGHIFALLGSDLRQISL